MNNYDVSEKDLILVVEDSEYLNNYISTHLKKHNYDVIQCQTEEDAYKALSNNLVSLVILDLNLGDDNGMNILRSIRKQNAILPVMIVSSIQDDTTKIEGFREGCDDYITKPFYIEELMLRIKRMLSKLSMTSYKKKIVAKTYTSGIFSVDADAMTVTKDGQLLQMRKKQFGLMLYFIQHPNVVLPFEAIYENVWGEPAPDEKTLESNMYVNIRTLREIIEEDKKNPTHIISVSKSGYIFIPQ